ncbi:MAG: hypothetical protein ACRDPK_05285 [Carbonactinosporaceae bacterium]
MSNLPEPRPRRWPEKAESEPEGEVHVVTSARWGIGEAAPEDTHVAPRAWPAPPTGPPTGPTTGQGAGGTTGESVLGGHSDYGFDEGPRSSGEHTAILPALAIESGETGSRSERRRHRRQRQRRTRGMIAAGVAGFLVLAVLGFLVGTLARGGGGDREQAPVQRSSGSSGSSGTFESQAKALDALLDSSAASRTNVKTAVISVLSCAGAGQAGEQLRAAARERELSVHRLDRLHTDRIPNGNAIARSLRSSWMHSARADRALAGWADQVAAGGCQGGEPPQTAEYQTGVRSSIAARQAKQEFVDRWNPVARSAGLPARSENHI